MSDKTYFISYTTRTAVDKAWAIWTEWVLRVKLGDKAIIQEYDCHPGDNFKKFMDNALKKADAVVCILTRDYMESDYCIDEWTNADKIIPVRFDDCNPCGLLKSQVYIDLYSLDKDSAREKLLKALEGPPPRPAGEPKAPFALNGADAEPHYPKYQIAINNLPPRNRYFTGRDDALSKINAGFQSSYPVIVTGSGGFGKTQTAVEYAYRHISEYNYIWCFNAESEMRLQDDYREFALRNLGLATAREGEFDVVYSRIDEWFRNTVSYLLIYDNAEGCPDLKNYLPQAQPQKHVIINSRERLYGIVAEIIDASVFSPEDAVDFLQKRIPGTGADNARKLADALGCHPLALEQAASYIYERNLTVTKYIDLWKKYELKVLETAPMSADYNRTVYTTWKTTYDKVEQLAKKNKQVKAATQLFRLCTYCAPDDIPLQMFVESREKIPQPLCDALDPYNEIEFYDIIEILTRYSLVSIKHDSKDSAFLSIHRLLQKAANYGFEGNKEWVDCCLEIAGDVFDFEYATRDDFDKFTLYLPHMTEIARHSKIFNNDDDNAQKKMAQIYFRAGYGLEKKGNYVKALAWFCEALAICKEVFGVEQPETANVYYRIATVYLRQGNFIKSLEWFDKAVEINEKVQGTLHTDTANTYNNIALVYKDQGEYCKALEWYYKALAIYEEILGTSHPYTATSYNNIAGVYQYQGDYGKALEWYYKALAIHENALVTSHPDTANTYNNIACVYREQGDYDKALEWHNKALAIRENVLGTSHPYTAITYNDIASVYKGQGEYDSALEWYLKALAILEEVLGTSHPYTAFTYNNIAVVYQYQGEYEKALAWHNKALAIREKALGTSHPDTATTYRNIAELYRSQGEYAKARDLFCRAVIIKNKYGLTEHQTTKSARRALLDCYKKAGGKEEDFDSWFEEQRATYPAWCDGYSSDET